MSEVREIIGDTPTGREPPEVAHVLNTARALADEEFNRAERFDRKALNLATIVGAFFSLSQIVVVSALSAESLDLGGSTVAWLRWVGVAATLLAGLAVGTCLLIFRVRKERTADLDDVRPFLTAAQRGNSDVTGRLVLISVEIAKDRREVNAIRTSLYRKASWLALFAVAATACELALVLFAIT